MIGLNDAGTSFHTGNSGHIIVRNVEYLLAELIYSNIDFKNNAFDLLAL